MEINNVDLQWFWVYAQMLFTMILLVGVFLKVYLVYSSVLLGCLNLVSLRQ
eukprot:UN03207